jgi:hypothetical protein
MYIYVTRTKLFLHNLFVKPNSTRPVRFFAPRSPQRIEAPDWIKETDTYKMGIKDGSIVDLTPAAPAPAKPAAPAPKPAQKPAPEKEADPGKSAGLQG